MDDVIVLGDLRRAVLVSPDSQEARLALAQGLYHIGDLDAAIDECHATIKLNPNNAKAHVQLGILNCLRHHNFDMQATAKTLGWDGSTVTQRLKGLCFQALVEAAGDHANAALAIAGDPSHQRTVELKLMDYHNHLISVIEPFTTADVALLDCKRRFKNLPDRHFSSVETLVRQYFRQKKESTFQSRIGT
ncbi:MAG: tetratricopeptide repeat protein [Nitrospira sp.]|nr:tetratricopeptide repeat protein [Nitrospira sp.]